MTESENFIKKSSLKHNNKYSYEKVEYIDCHTDVIIICPLHGDFLQKPRSHVRGYGCHVCGKQARIDKISTTQDEFIINVNNIHNLFYDYSKTIYKGRRHKIIIICPEHGEFEQRADSHLNGDGCPKCFAKNLSISRIKNQQDVIDQMNKIHNFKYDYSNVEYKLGTLNIEIICPLHGSFYQEPSNHLQGSGCPICGNILAAQNRTYSNEEFIELCNKVHNNKYDYSKTEYKGYNSYIIIICHIHGEFKQRANNHLSGHDCKKCNKISVSKVETAWLDSLNISNTCRQVTITINNKKFKPDAYNSQTNTIYEFYGDFWHGNPKIFDPNKINLTNKKSFGTLYQNTINRENIFKSAGYNIISIWEHDWKQSLKQSS